MITPIQLECLLHHYYSTEKWPLNNPAQAEAIIFLKIHELVRWDNHNNVHKVTDRGMCYLDHIFKLPFPVNKWRMPT